MSVFLLLLLIRPSPSFMNVNQTQAVMEEEEVGVKEDLVRYIHSIPFSSIFELLKNVKKFHPPDKPIKLFQNN